MSKQVIHELAIATQQGKMTFPQVVKGLLEAGVESYLVDFATKQKTHYLANGTTHTVPLILDPGPIAEDFNGAGLVAAIRGAQADTVRYPEFVKRSTTAGVIGYYDALNKTIGTAKTSESVRLYMAPGMNHCGGGEGPNSFDMLAAMEQWVENGKAPNEILASHLTARRSTGRMTGAVASSSPDTSPSAAGIRPLR